MRQPFRIDARARVSIVDVIMTFGSLVALVGIAPWVFDLVTLLQDEADPLTGVLLALVLPLMFVALLLSIGVSARS